MVGELSRDITRKCFHSGTAFWFISLWAPQVAPSVFFKQEYLRNSHSMLAQNREFAGRLFETVKDSAKGTHGS